MQKLVEGIHHFQRDVFSSKRQLFERLAQGQHPQALFITCSDSRINPHLLTQMDPGELFVLRNAGNIVPQYAVSCGGEAAAIEYAVRVLGVKDAVVCGHSHCGAMTALLDQEQLDELPAFRSWLVHAEAIRVIIEDNYRHVTDSARRLTTAVEENVLVQLEHLRTHPAVADAIERKALTLHGWVYQFETGQVFAYDPEREQFSPIGALASEDRDVA